MAKFKIKEDECSRITSAVGLKHLDRKKGKYVFIVAVKPMAKIVEAVYALSIKKTSRDENFRLPHPLMYVVGQSNSKEDVELPEIDTKVRLK